MATKFVLDVVTGEMVEEEVTPEEIPAVSTEVAKAAAEEQITRWTNQTILALKMLEPELFYVAMLSNIAFGLLDWSAQGRPDEPDPVRHVVTYAEAQAYREAHAGTGNPEEAMTAKDLLLLQETRWNEMQQGFAAIVYQRRLALEKIKLAQPGENLEAELAVILAELRGEF
jgi:hypothetical protein